VTAPLSATDIDQQMRARMDRADFAAYDYLQVGDSPSPMIVHHVANWSDVPNDRVRVGDERDPLVAHMTHEVLQPGDAPNTVPLGVDTRAHGVLTFTDKLGPQVAAIHRWPIGQSAPHSVVICSPSSSTAIRGRPTL
jgi:hypothetical protein